ncbi:MAG: flagellar biosynthesis anti-sigma factor FlgM [Bacillota bacterium]|nr:flagellar biosynthesis anti-sigma factor FlgM [Bacillota bacterium]
MKISNRQIQSVIEAYQKRLEAVDSGQRAGVARRSGSRSDRVEFSADAQELARLAQMVRQMPEVREDVVRQLAETLKDGSYHVPARDVAEKMVVRYLADHLQ